MALSKQTYTGDGVAQEFTFSIPRIKDADLKAFVDDVEVSIEDITGNTVRLDNVPADGSEVIIQRRTNIDNLEVEFPNRGYIGQADLETDYLQELYLHQEASDDRDDLQEAIDNSEGGGEADGNGIYSDDGIINQDRNVDFDYEQGTISFNWETIDTQTGLASSSNAFSSSFAHDHEIVRENNLLSERSAYSNVNEALQFGSIYSADNHRFIEEPDFSLLPFSVSMGMADTFPASGEGSTGRNAYGVYSQTYVGSVTGDLIVDVDLVTGDSVAGGQSGIRGKAYYNGVEIATLDDVGLRNGFIDYNDTSTSSSALVVSADTWTTIPNNGAGAFSNNTYKPNGNVTELMDTSNGAIDPTGLELGDTILIRNDFSVTPSTNNASLEFRYTLGDTGAGTNYVLEKRLGRLDEGSGIPYRFSLSPDLIYMGDTNTRNNPIQLQVKCTSNATLVNAGSVIQVIRR